MFKITFSDGSEQIAISTANAETRIENAFANGVTVETIVAPGVANDVEYGVTWSVTIAKL